MRYFLEEMPEEVAHLIFAYQGSITRLGLKKLTQGLCNTEFIGLIVDVDAYKDLVDRIMPDNDAQWDGLRQQGMRPIAVGTQLRIWGEFLAKTPPEMQVAFAQPLPNPSTIFLFVLGETQTYLTLHDLNAPPAKIVGFAPPKN